jgi:hypothetical protein
MSCGALGTASSSYSRHTKGETHLGIDGPARAGGVVRAGDRGDLAFRAGYARACWSGPITPGNGAFVTVHGMGHSARPGYHSSCESNRPATFFPGPALFVCERHIAVVPVPSTRRACPFARVRRRGSAAASVRAGARHSGGTIGSGAGDAGGRCRRADGAGGDGSGESRSGLGPGDSGPGGKAGCAGTGFRPGRSGRSGRSGDGRDYGASTGSRSGEARDSGLDRSGA